MTKGVAWILTPASCYPPLASAGAGCAGTSFRGSSSSGTGFGENDKDMGLDSCLRRNDRKRQEFEGNNKMIFRKIVVFSGLLVLLILGAKFYIGFHYFYRYKEARSQAESIEGSFSQLELNLKKAVSCSKNYLFYREMGRLYLERALAEEKFGTVERRDFYLERARESLIKAVRRNPIDASAYYGMGTVYLLYNYPLLTYLEKAKRYFRRALELKPADEFLHENIIYIYLTQWEWLEEEEKDFVGQRVRAMVEMEEREGKGGIDGRFVRRLRSKWKENFGEVEGLEKILGTIGNE